MELRDINLKIVRSCWLILWFQRHHSGLYKWHVDSSLRKMTETKSKKCYVVGFEDARRKSGAKEGRQGMFSLEHSPPPCFKSSEICAGSLS